MTLPSEVSSEHCDEENGDSRSIEVKVQPAGLEPSICYCDGRGNEGCKRRTTVGAVVGRRSLPYGNDQGGTKKEACVMSRKFGGQSTEDECRKGRPGIIMPADLSLMGIYPQDVQDSVKWRKTKRMANPEKSAHIAFKRR